MQARSVLSQPLLHTTLVPPLVTIISPHHPHLPPHLTSPPYPGVSTCSRAPCTSARRSGWRAHTPQAVVAATERTRSDADACGHRPYGHPGCGHPPPSAHPPPGICCPPSPPTMAVISARAVRTRSGKIPPLGYGSEIVCVRVCVCACV